jgi:hypothetical protein
VVAAFTQLRLARTRGADLPLVWERRYDPGRLRPVRVHGVVSSLLAELWARQRRRRNPAEDLPGGPKAFSLAGPNATRRSSKLPEAVKRANARGFAMSFSPSQNPS